MSSNILCIYPDDSSTRFLDRIQNYLKRKLGDEFHCYKVKPNDDSHYYCLERLRTNTTEELVIFLGHGRSDCLYGANTNYNFFASPYYEGVSDYQNDNFINSTNIAVFSEKKVFCLSCNSAEKLGEWAVQKGATVFIGFGDIPTDNEILPKLGIGLPTLIARFKGEINWIVKKSLAFSIAKNHSFYQLADTVRLLTNARINDIILTHKSLRQRRLLTDYLFSFKSEMVVSGDGNELLRG